MKYLIEHLINYFLNRTISR